ncbi:MAG: hypothetical protein H6573_11000 [Lewinellaceae bacterium]|nr:hypothetical protein [Phaeodactylibacter sp.]MCB0612577.1 hypothetical protein [Phaeodactylibacter sp.]MCB9348019.1 hypothetical protein [Lewinellaceae bacterium]
MEHRYSRPQGGGTGMLLRLLGFIFAMILVIGMLDKAGLKISIEGREGKDANPRYKEASVGETYAEEEKGGEVIHIGPSQPAKNYREGYQPGSYDAYSRQAPSRSTQAPASVETFISRFAETANVQALNKGVPAGISLALGIVKLKQGERIDNWEDFMDKVVMPLARIKENAYQDGLQGYFKYSANSGRWLEGLSRQGTYSFNALRQAMQAYRLDYYDQQVRTALVEGTKVAPEMDRQASYVADEVSSHIVKRRIANEQATYNNSNRNAKVEEWENFYDESVGREVAKEIAKRKLKTGKYLTDDDMGRLVEEANVETEKVLKKNLSFLGRDINRNHPDAPEMLDITQPDNAQARQELYQKKVREREYAGNQ